MCQHWFYPTDPTFLHFRCMKCRGTTTANTISMLLTEIVPYLDPTYAMLLGYDSTSTSEPSPSRSEPSLSSEEESRITSPASSVYLSDNSRGSEERKGGFFAT